MAANETICEIVDEISTELEEIEHQPSIVCAAGGRAPEDGFRPLTEAEKKEFVFSLNTSARNGLAEPGGATRASSDRGSEPVPLCGL